MLFTDKYIKYIWFVNFLVTLFLKDPELIWLHIVKYFYVLQCNTNKSTSDICLYTNQSRYLLNIAHILKKMNGYWDCLADYW